MLNTAHYTLYYRVNLDVSMLSDNSTGTGHFLVMNWNLWNLSSQLEPTDLKTRENEIEDEIKTPDRGATYPM